MLFISKRVFWTLLFFGFVAGCGNQNPRPDTDQIAEPTASVPERARPYATRPEIVQTETEVFSEIPPPVIGKPNWFNTKEECVSAVQMGEYDFYEPLDLDGSGRNPADGTTKEVFQLEAVHCVLMQTAIEKGAYKWVPQNVGTEMRRYVADGRIYARHNCGNPVKDAVAVPFPTRRVVFTPTLPPETEEFVEVTFYEESNEYLVQKEGHSGYWNVGGFVAGAVIVGAICFVTGVCDFGDDDTDIIGPITNPPTIDDINTHPGVSVNTH